MMALSLLAGILRDPVLLPGWLPGAFGWLAGALLLREIGRYHRVQILLMCGAGAAAIAFASLHGNRSWIPELAAGNHALLAMLAAVSFLRLLAGEVGAAGGALPRGPRAVRSTVLAAHLLGAVINISAPLIIGDRIALRGRLSPLQAKALSRPFTAAAMWSPFFAAMALVLHHLPEASIARMSGVGFCVAVLLVGYCALTLPREAAAADFVGFPVRLEALRVPLVLGLLVILGRLAWPALAILTLIGCAALVTAAGFLLAQNAGSAVRRLGQHVLHRLPEMAGELTLFLAAAVMAAGLNAAARASGFALGFESFDSDTAALLLAGLIVLALCGVHIVVSMSALVAMSDLGTVDPSLLGLVFLLAWGLGLVISPFSGTTLALQGRFGVRASAFVRWNLGYVLVGYCVAVLALQVYGRLA